MTLKNKPRPSYLTKADYLRDVLKLTTKQLVQKWGVTSRSAYSHQRLGAAEIRRRLAEVEHG